MDPARAFRAINRIGSKTSPKPTERYSRFMENPKVFTPTRGGALTFISKEKAMRKPKKPHMKTGDVKVRFHFWGKHLVFCPINKWH
jgi:hypothetical protein